MDDRNYFVCTLGQASGLKQIKNYKTIPEFLDRQAEDNPDLPAVGFYEVLPKPSGLVKAHVHTFLRVRDGVRSAAKRLQSLSRLEEKQTVALLCPSSAVFLYSWLALIYLGHRVLLVAPQCSPSAVAHLCKVCDVKVICHHSDYSRLAREAHDVLAEHDGRELRPIPLPFEQDVDLFQTPLRSEGNLEHSSTSLEDDVAYLHHTSGTSSGLPKPIPQTHRGGLRVLPRLDGREKATFTTTPLYHGGVADIFRAWTSDALILIFPGKDSPITIGNIVKCLQESQKSAARGISPPVRYFSSVPYVLQSMALDEQGLSMLQAMEIVGVGGAALPEEVGDALVAKGVNLASRYGSAECGFLMSSYRNFSNDKEWSFLRANDSSRLLKFEEREDDLYELVVQPAWPHMAKRNRQDGSYATCDLFKAHPRIKDAWRYHSRADSQLTLITGKKFDPAPLEAELSASTSYLEEVLIFGEGKPYPGALLFRSKGYATATNLQVIDKIWPLVERSNMDSQSHSRFSREMLLPMPYSDMPLEKSSKGTVMRMRAEQRYSNFIDSAYEAEEALDPDEVSDAEIPQTILHLVNTVLKAQGNSGDDLHLDTDTDLFASGLDSVASMRIRNIISRLLPQSAPKLPPTVVEDNGTIARLSEFIVDLRHGRQLSKTDDQVQLMEDLLKKHRILHDSETVKTRSRVNGHTASLGKLTILMTGPTGSLGSHLLHQILQHENVTHVYLLVRGANEKACAERVLKALKHRRLPIAAEFETVVTILPCKLSDSDLGLSAAQYQRLCDEVDVVAHLAWAVNFLLPLRGFASHLAALNNLLSLAISSTRDRPPRFLFCSTVASVSQHPTPIPEAIVSDPSACGPTGYGRSKWVAEQICLSAAQSARLRDKISIIRVGQLSGASDTGVWATSEAYPLILSTFDDVDCLPDLDATRAGQSRDGKGKELLNWLPVDIAAIAFTHLMFSEGDPAPSEPGDAGIKTYHLLPPPQIKTASWTDLISIISKHESSPVAVVSVDKWLEKLETLGEHEETKDHSALRLVPFWRDAYCASTVEAADYLAGMPKGHNAGKGDPKDHGGGGDEVSRSVSGGFQMCRTLKHLPILHQARALDDEYVMKLWRWIKESRAN